MANNKENPSDLLKGHRERLRERIRRDPGAVADYEILELLLGLAITRKDTKVLARALMERFSSFRGVLDARADELLEVPGFGSGLMSLWMLMREILARYSASPMRQREILASPEAVAQMGRQRLGHLSHEESWLALVDAQNRLISWEKLRKGSISSVYMEPRDVLEAALLHKASGIILVHNHPGGNPQPSMSDLDLTTQIKNLAPHLGLRFLDHVIITAGDCYSIGQGKLLHDIGVI